MKKKLLIACAIVLLVFVSGTGVFAYLLFHRVQGQFFDSNGVRIHYTVEGRGEPVILVHGVGANADLNWRRPGITRMLARDFTVIAFDLRGHGLSGQPTGPGQYGMEMVEDIVRLMDHLSIQKAHVAGYSLGGFLLLKLLATHPDRVRSAAICAAGWKDPDDPSPVPNPYKPSEAWIKTSAEDPGARTQNLHAAMPPASWAGALVHRVRNWVGDHISNKAAIKACKRDYAELAVKRESLTSNKVPAICFVGTRDGFVHLAEDLEKNMANLQFEIINGASHLTTPLYPKFRRGLHDFLIEHRTEH